MKIKRLIFVGLLAVLMLLTAGCSAKRITDEQIKNDVLSTARDWDDDAIVDSFIIVERDYDEEEKTESVFVKLEGRTDLIYLLRYYRLDYFYSKDEGWLLSEIDEDDEDLWETTPLVGPDLSLAEESLMGQSIYIYDEEVASYGYLINYASELWEIGEDNIKEITIDESSLVIDGFEASVNCSFTLENKNVTVSGSATVDFEFDAELIETKNEEVLTKDGWYVKSSTLSEDYTYQFKSERKPSLTAEEVRAQFSGNNINFNSNGENPQFVWLREDYLSDVTVSDPMPANYGEQAVFSVEYKYTNDLVSILVNEVYAVEYDAAMGEWKEPDMYVYDSNCVEVNLPTEWVGAYTNSSGEMYAKLTFTKIEENGDLEAVFEFSPMPNNTSGESGSYKMKGSYDPNTLEIELNGTSWIDRPSWYSYINIDGIIKINNSSIYSSDSSMILYPKSNAEQIEKYTEIYDEVNLLTENQKAELDAAIDKINDEYGVGVIVLVISALDDNTYLDRYYYDWCDEFNSDEFALLEINFGEKLDILSLYTPEFDGFEPFNDTLLEYYYGGNYAKTYQQFVKDVYRYLGGNEADLKFSW